MQRKHCVCVCLFLLSTQLFVLPLKHHPSLFNLAAEYSDLIIWADIRISQALLPSSEGTNPQHTHANTPHGVKVNAYRGMLRAHPSRNNVFQ